MAANLINGKAYDHTQLEIRLLGGQVFGVQNINYQQEQEKENNFGVGNNPVSRGKGAKNTSVSIELSMNDVEAIRDSVATRNLLDIPAFDINITFLNEQRVVNHVIKNAEFVNDGVESSVGDKDITRSFDLVASDILYK